jgi:hypothetical protein
MNNATYYQLTDLLKTEQPLSIHCKKKWSDASYCMAGVLFEFSLN